MATVDEKPEPRATDPIDILAILIGSSLRLVFYVLAVLVVIVFGILGLGVGAAMGLPLGNGIAVIGGILGLSAGIVLGIVAIVAAVVGVWFGAIAMIFALAYIFLADLDARAESGADPEGDCLAGDSTIMLWPPPDFRAAVIVAVTAVLWVKYGLPALRRAETWAESRDTFLGAVVLPLGFIGMVLRHWLAILVEPLSWHPRPERTGTPRPPHDDPGLPDFLSGPGPR